MGDERRISMPGRADPAGVGATSLTPADVEVTAVTPHGWRIVDRRAPLRSRGRVLAFVEHQRDRFEVMQLGAGFEWDEFESLRAAVEFVVRMAPRMAEVHRGPRRRDVSA